MSRDQQRSLDLDDAVPALPSQANLLVQSPPLPPQSAPLPPQEEEPPRALSETLRPFIIYDDALRQFDYPRALTQRLIRDHEGAMPALVELWWTALYEGLLTLLFWLFQLSMPLHILLILYCKVRGGADQRQPGERAHETPAEWPSALSDSDEPPG